MDQQAFRQLLSTPRHDDSGQGSSSRNRYFGKQNKAVSKESPLNTAELIPRKIGAASNKSHPSSSRDKPLVIKSSTGEIYVDRAEARRLGVDSVNDDGDIEALRHEYKQKIEAAEDEEEREKLRKLMEQLRGDGKQSAVTKGLDYALLAQQKAKLNGSSNAKEIDDDGLEEAYGSGGIEVKVDEEEKNMKEVAVESKFRPIGSSAGFKPIGKGDEGQPEYIWRDGKRLRKKKKKKPGTAENGANEESLTGIGTSRDASKQQLSNGVREANTQEQKPGKLTAEQKNIEAAEKKIDREREEMPPPRLVPSTSPKEPVVAEAIKEESSESEDDSTDIFADAGRWNGLEDDNDEEGNEEGELTGPVTIAPTSHSGKRDWFNTGRNPDREEGKADKVALPSSLTSILDNAHEAKEKHKAAQDTKSGSGKEEEESKPQRLEGLSDSILGREGMRYMLEKKDDDRNNQMRKRKRSKKGKGGYGSD